MSVWAAFFVSIFIITFGLFCLQVASGKRAAKDMGAAFLGSLLWAAIETAVAYGLFFAWGAK